MKRRVVGRMVDGKLVMEPETAAERERRERNVREMLESGCAPLMGNSDRAFLYGRHDTQNLDGIFADKYRERARKAGINPNGRIYLSTLADRRGPADPDAWVSGLSDVRAACLKKGKGCAPLGIPEREAPPPKPVKLAPDIVNELAVEELKRDPTLAETPKKREALKKRIVEKHGNPAVSE